jgi:hypothetical protein
MLIREKNTLADFLLLFGLFLIALFPGEDAISFVLISILVAYPILRFKASPLSPFFFLAPAAPYLLISVSFILSNNLPGIARFCSVAFFALLSFSISLRLFYKIDTRVFRYHLSNARLFYSLYFLSLSALFLIHLASSSDGFSLAGKALNLSLRPALLAIMLGCVAAISTKHLFRGVLMALGYLVYVLFLNFGLEDGSRFSFLDVAVFVIIAILFGSHFTVVRLFRGSRFIVASFVFLLVSLFLFGSKISNVEEFGGDALILYQAIETISLADTETQPLMPLHNGLLIFVPETFWIGSKLENFNSSAWYIENVMGYDPEIYPWGVGVTLFAASYLYGGFVGVFLMFFAVGFFVSKLSGMVQNPFWVGFVCLFFSRLPFAFYRMDETFLIGAFVPAIAVIILFKRRFRSRINRSFI